MIPKALIDVELELSPGTVSTKTYKLSAEKVQGFTDGIEALQQAIYKVLSTEKYEYPIYGFDYGIELENLIGEDPTYVQIELKRRIRECLLQDERIQSVENFVIIDAADEMLCTFEVISIYGSLTISKELSI